MRHLILLAAVLATHPAAAAGGFWCDVDDDQVRMTIRSGVSRDSGRGLSGFGAEVTIRDQAVSQDLRETGFAVPSQYWFDDRSLNLLLYERRAPEAPRGHVAVKIMTSANDEDQLVGSYEIEVDDVPAFGPDGVRRYAGPIACSFD